MRPSLGKRRSYTDLAFCGALLGAMLVLAHNVWTILSGHFDASDPFMYVMSQAIGSAAAGAVLSVLLGLVHRRFVQRM